MCRGRKFRLKQEQPKDVNTDRELHKIDAKDKVEKNWRVKHVVHIPKWNDHSEYIYHGEILSLFVSNWNAEKGFGS